MRHWFARQVAKSFESVDVLLAPATQIVRNRADYLGEGQDDVGQRIGDDKLELFVSLEPAQASHKQPLPPDQPAGRQA